MFQGLVQIKKTGKFLFRSFWRRLYRKLCPFAQQFGIGLKNGLDQGIVEFFGLLRSTSGELGGVKQTIHLFTAETEGVRAAAGGRRPSLQPSS